MVGSTYAAEVIHASSKLRRTGSGQQPRQVNRSVADARQGRLWVGSGVEGLLWGISDYADEACEAGVAQREEGLGAGPRPQRRTTSCLKD